MPLPTGLVTTPSAPETVVAAGGGQADLLMVVRLGDRRFALPAPAIGRILPMAALIPLPDAPVGIAGVLALQGVVLPVVDPRPRLGVPLVAPRPEQHLVVIAARTRFLLWVDRAEAIVPAPPVAAGLPGADAASLASQFVRIGDEYLPLLAPAALDPGPVLQTSGPRAR